MRKINMRFRFNVEQLDAKTVEVQIPDGGTMPVINKDFAKMMELSSAEYDAAEEAVLREVAVIR